MTEQELLNKIKWLTLETTKESFLTKRRTDSFYTRKELQKIIGGQKSHQTNIELHLNTLPPIIGNKKEIVTIIETLLLLSISLQKSYQKRIGITTQYKTYCIENQTIQGQLIQIKINYLKLIEKNNILRICTLLFKDILSKQYSAFKINKNNRYLSFQILLKSSITDIKIKTTKSRKNTFN